jgi:hypothetical protein
VVLFRGKLTNHTGWKHNLHGAKTKKKVKEKKEVGQRQKSPSGNSQGHLKEP